MSAENDISLLPLHLWEQQPNNSWPIIAAYFEYAHTEDTLPVLDKLFTAAMDRQYRPVERHPGNLCFFIERLESLVYAAHLLLVKPAGMAINAKDRAVLQAFFRFNSWPQWRMHLHQLLQYALQGSSICEELNPALLPAMQQQLAGLVMTLHRLQYQHRHPAGSQLPPAVMQLQQHFTSLLQPQLVYATNDGGSGYSSLLFILPDTNTQPYKAYDELLQLAALQHPLVSISLHKFAAIKERMLAGQLFYNQVCVPANLLYSTGEEPLPCADKTRLANLRKDAGAVFTKEFAMAAKFLTAAGGFIRKKDFTGSGFLLHQAAEGCLRSLHLAFMGRELRSHSVQTLLHHAARFVPALGTVFAPGTASTNRLLTLLDAAYSEVRYNPAYNIAAADARLLYSKISLLHQLSKEQFGGR